MSRSRISHLILAGASAILAAAGLVAATPAAAQAATSASPVGPWIPQESTNVQTLGQGQGLATVYPPAGGSYLWYTGDTSIPIGTYAAGWTHVGDPDSVGGYVVEPYQGSGTSKMFRVWTPDPGHTSHDFVHALVSGEAMNNSFAAVSPDGQWLVSGEWGTMTRLLVYPMPLLNPEAPAEGGNLPLAATITLDRPVSDIQGCTFFDATRLLCSSDDATGLFGVTRPLLEVDLRAALTGADVGATVTALGALPMVSICSGTFEAEGIDYDRSTGDLRVEVVQPGVCVVATTVWRFRLS